MTASESLEIYGEVYSSLSVLSSFCKLERKTAAGCEACPFLNFCEIISDGEIVPFSTIITNLLLSPVSEKITEARRRINEEDNRRSIEYNPHYRRDKK